MDNTKKEILELQEEIERLHRENEKLMQDQLGHLAFGDIMCTIALLPLDPNPSAVTFEDRIRTALLLHGLNPQTATFDRLRAGFLLAANSARVKTIRAFVAGQNALTDIGQPLTTPDCSCVNCSSILAAAKIMSEDPAQAEGHVNDYYLTKTLEERETKSDRQNLETSVRALLQFFR